ncbi:MAG: UDP-N-acetylmuramoyl-L-alanyl-D-glutamate--2,6-diaminopimelate ligase [Omnitrophica WOR_2 bacterium GWF2_43_52]|nr:MAG: UDP-N-acetylmuramoyl-L-alanyl-D-glutamate--2,6-diaminopimelate ligase [Omnitrophica WOR_2 bacterium GWC2_44_8]OGX20927.1 MAG: UDP-N-acetylmuramoyl-L-alanyl-D-glutamate--2,6-diaminopimelate ligase [Omnitrophica WOR_2 bacterium GWF2_43_52]OGX55075.1 MAG: UDP-N-acetylmuramoyl-L-alanyl-D-glutamate--2,6-diaminopimelate ligase [Omnitrophica WOR_2 bacterium RIFOXYC2_FULL_43_9]
MKLSQLLKRIDNKRFSSCGFDRDIVSICSDSKAVRPGALFVAIDGAKAKGSEFVAEAVIKGAVCIIAPLHTPSPVSAEMPFITFPDTRYALAVAADEFFGHPSGRIKVVGVTGTNGKTTITYLIRSILREAHFSAGILGTIGSIVKDTLIPALNTTPGAIEVQSLLQQMIDAGCHYCVMEVSSHGLDQKRVEAIDFTAGIFTNLTQDHLDYHIHLENYFLAKAKLFTALSKDAYALLNLDCPYGRRLVGMTQAPVVSFAIDSDADLRATDIKLSLDGSEFRLRSKEHEVTLSTRLIGRHNISNILASVAFSLTQGIGLEDIAKAVTAFSGVKGRLEKVCSADRNIFVDYAHTPDALENVLRILRQLSGGKLIVVFGCGGDRDRLKRPLMGSAAERYADTIIITSDNPRSEEPKDIAEAIASGIATKRYTIILDRREAIYEALRKAGSNDTILIAGKGHENYQIFKDKKVAFDDIIVAQECLRALGSHGST